MNASVGDYVLAIDGEELKGTDDPYRLLRNKADNPVQFDFVPFRNKARLI